MTRRQEILYTDTVDIWSPSTPTGANSDGTTKDTVWAKTYTAQLCKYFAKPDEADTSPIGRTNRDLLATMDRYHFPIEVVIDDGHAIVLKTAGHPDNGECWLVQGNAESHKIAGARRTNYKFVLCKRAKRPSGVTV